MKTILEMLAIVALVAIVFGVSMHDAFWGIIIFIVGIIVFVIAMLFLGYGLIVASEKIKRRMHPTEEEKAKRKKARLSEIEGALLLIWLFSPWAFVIIFSTVFKEFTEKHDWVLLFAFAPYIIPIGAYIIIRIISKVKSHRRPKERAEGE